MVEIWKSIKGYEGLYEVSNLGRVKSLERTMKHWRGGDSIVREKILEGWSHKQGYRMVTLSHREFQVHRLVGQVFVPNPENKPDINHKNGIKFDNFYKNLEWCTHLENMRHAYATGLIPPRAKGEDQPFSKMTDITVLEAREKYSTGKYSYNGLAKEYGVNKKTMIRLIKKRSWKHI